MKRLVLIGSKDLAHQIRQYAEETGDYHVIGYLDDFEEVGVRIDGLPILGGLKDAECIYKQGLFDYLFIAAGYNNFKFRETAFEMFKGKVPFATIIMKNVQIGDNVKIGDGVYIGPDSIIGSNTTIEDNVFIHQDTHIAHDNVIRKHTYISGRLDTAGFCQIGSRNFIGIRVLFSEHISTCDDVWIGLGCIVTKSIKENGKYMSPCTKLYKIE